MCETQDGQWRLDSRNECVKRSEWWDWAILVETCISFSAFAVVEAMVATCECGFVCCDCEIGKGGTMFNIAKEIFSSLRGILKYIHWFENVDVVMQDW